MTQAFRQKVQKDRPGTSRESREWDVSEPLGEFTKHPIGQCQKSPFDK